MDEQPSLLEQRILFYIVYLPVNVVGIALIFFLSICAGHTDDNFMFPYLYAGFFGMPITFILWKSKSIASGIFRLVVVAVVMFLLLQIGLFIMAETTVKVNDSDLYALIIIAYIMILVAAWEASELSLSVYSKLTNQ